MSRREYGDYYLGLDIGTESVGWAVTNPDYQLMKFGKKTMWGVRLFPEAQTAAERRLFRVSRRRLERRAQRLALLQELFAEEIKKVDPGFFMRLQEGALHEEDKTVPQPNNLFYDAVLTDKKYHRLYPTIYHLRRSLISSDSPHDIRLVYLAIHHIIKYRGHFLFGGKLDEVPALDAILSEISDEAVDCFGFSLPCGSMASFAGVLTDRSLRMSVKQKKLYELLEADSPRARAFIRAMTGGKVNLSDLFDVPEAVEQEKIKIAFGTDEYEALQPELEELLGEQFYYLDKIRAIHDWAALESIVGGGRTLSDAKVTAYEEHRRDLKLLKRVVKRYLPAEYGRVFHRADEKNNYTSYIGMTRKNGRKIPVTARCSQADFHKFVAGLLKGLPEDDPDIIELQERLATGQLMPRAVTRANSIIPNQLHYIELKAILQKAGNYHPFLNQKDGEGLTVADKILQILTFRIPYYVGPLNNRDPRAENTWAVRRTHERILPWNFDRVVDKEASAAEFITRMTSCCTYLRDQKVLPRHSVLYSRFTVLNELNNLKLDGDPIPVALKQDIYTQLFLQRRRVTRKSLVDFLNSKGLAVDRDSVSGIDQDFHSSMASLLDMQKLLGAHYTEETAEEIIRLSTIFGEDRNMLHARLANVFGKVLPAETLRRASTLRFRGWGNLSAAFLTGIKSPDSQTGELLSIMDLLWHTNNNLMQLLSRDYGFAGQVAQHNRLLEEGEGFSYRMVEDLYVSPAVRRAIWQALLVTREIRKIMGHDPMRLFIEVARGEEKKERKESRKKRLGELYKACGEEAAHLAASLEARDERELRRDRLYLYYTQMGRCMYSGEPVDVDRLFDEQVYDIDHIFPQSKVKDDSLSNRVLVRRTENMKKGDAYPISQSVRQSQAPFWRMLLQKRLISKQKYERLARSTPLQPDELLGFIARQLVETRQSTKAAAEILGRLMPRTDIVYVKAGLVSDFRKKTDLLKCREVNDLHHAGDAYLNVVVGNVYHTKFTQDPRKFFAQPEPDRHYNLRTLFDYDVRRGGVTAWRAGEGGSIRRVKDMMRRYNALVTWMPFEQGGQLFDTQLVRKGAWQLPQSMARECFRDSAKYGGYNKVKGSYFMLVEHDEGKKDRARSLIDMPLHLAGAVRDEEALQAMLEGEKGLKNPVVILPKIRMNALFDIDGFRMRITGRTGNNVVYAPAMQLVVGYHREKYIRDVLKFAQRSAEYRRENRQKDLQAEASDGIDRDRNLALYDIFLMKLRDTVYKVRLGAQADNLDRARDRFMALDAGAQCDVLKEILNIFACNRSTADLKALGLGGQLGIVSTSRTLSRYGRAWLVHQSVTGLFERQADLLA